MSTAVARRQQYAPGWGECIACEGSGMKSRQGQGKPPECSVCDGSGTVPVEVDGNPPQLSSASNEQYTPSEIVEASRELMGGIELDPASCPMAQDVVQATAWYGPDSPFGEDGLAEPGAGKVLLNPPGGRVPVKYAGMGSNSNAALWWAVWSSMWQAGEIEQMLFVGFTLEILRSAQQIPDIPQPLDFPFCVPSSRINFDTPNTIREKGKHAGKLIDPSKPAGARVSGNSPTHANVLVWLPPLFEEERKILHRVNEDVGEFERLFSPIGRVRS